MHLVPPPKNILHNHRVRFLMGRLLYRGEIGNNGSITVYVKMLNALSEHLLRKTLSFIYIYIFFPSLCWPQTFATYSYSRCWFVLLLKPMHAKVVWRKTWPLCITFFIFPLAVLRPRYCKQVYISEYILSSKLHHVLLHGFELVYSMPV